MIIETEANPEPNANGKPTGKISLAWQGLLLKEQAYRSVGTADHPFRQGLGILLTIALLVGTAQAAGLALDLLTTPRLDLVQVATYAAVIRTPWYAAGLAQSPDFGPSFEQLYLLSWEVIRILGGLPSGLGVVTVFGVGFIFTFLSWFVYGSLVHLTARWQLGSATYGQFMGTFALSFAPQLLLVTTMMPGLRVPALLINVWMLAARFQAVKHSHSLSWGHSLAALIIPYVGVGLTLFGIALFAAAISLSQVPAINYLINTNRLIQELQWLLN